jgi:hypothetical protein
MRPSASPSSRCSTLQRAPIHPNRLPREQLIAKAETGKIMSEVVDMLTLKYLHRNRYKDEAFKRIVRDMAADTGVKAFVRQARTIMSRPDS